MLYWWWCVVLLFFFKNLLQDIIKLGNRQQNTNIYIYIFLPLFHKCLIVVILLWSNCPTWVVDLCSSFRANWVTIDFIYGHHNNRKCIQILASLLIKCLFVWENKYHVAFSPPFQNKAPCCLDPHIESQYEVDLMWQNGKKFHGYKYFNQTLYIDEWMSIWFIGSWL